MAFTFVKFPKKYLLSEEWHKPRKYTRAEALLYLISESEIPSIGYLAKVFQWSKSTVHSFINEMVEQGFIERKSNDLPNENRTHNQANIRELQQSAERKSNDLPNENRTHTKEIKNITPLILSTTNVVSNIYPPKGEYTQAEKGDDSMFLSFQGWIAENAPRVAKMKEPFTAEQYWSLKKEFDSQFICEILKAMHNYQPLTTKNRSAYLTFRNWAKRQRKDENNKPTFNASKAAKPSTDALLRAVANGISRARTEQ